MFLNAFDTTFPSFPGAGLPVYTVTMPPALKTRHKRGTKKRKPVNYHGRSSAKTVVLQARVRELLARSHSGFTVSQLGEELGISRQLALYHLKKMVATGQILMVLEPCRENSGVRFRCWDLAQMLVNFRAAA
jgi:DNA-binding CsgD family transcriptional regulator